MKSAVSLTAAIGIVMWSFAWSSITDDTASVAFQLSGPPAVISASGRGIQRGVSDIDFFAPQRQDWIDGSPSVAASPK
jgi:hypothetical protein